MFKIKSLVFTHNMTLTVKQAIELTNEKNVAKRVYSEVIDLQKRIQNLYSSESVNGIPYYNLWLANVLNLNRQ